MLLPGPRAALDVIETADILPPGHFARYLIELAILYHHRVNDSKEALIAWEQASSARQSIALE